MNEEHPYFGRISLFLTILELSKSVIDRGGGAFDAPPPEYLR